MDTTPTQAPPAIVSSTQQETVDGLARLVAVQSWLADQQRAMPALPASPIVEDRDAWLTSLDEFWQQPVSDTPGAAAMPRLDALAIRLAAMLRDDAIVRRLDGTLDATAASLADRFARSLPGHLPPGLEARSLRIGSVDYAGAVIVLERGDPSRVLRFMPDRGWDVFDSLDHLHVQTEHMLRQQLARRRDLPGVRADDTEQVLADDRFVDSLPVQGDVFRGMVRRIAALQRDKVSDAWPTINEPVTSTRFVDDATLAIDLHDKLNVFAILVEREGQLAVALNEQRLARVPADVSQGWRRAMEGYQLARRLAAASARHHADETPLTLAAWSRKELVAAFSRRRIEVDPDDVEIEAGGSEPSAMPPIRISLAEFALRNTGYYDERRLRVVTAGLRPGVPAPTLQALRDVVRELNLAPRFETYLRDQVSDPQGRRFRNATMRLQQARMRVVAANARMATYLRDEPAVFIDDHEERGFRMVEAVLDGPVAATRRTVGDHRLVVRQLVYQGAVVSDVLIIGVRDARSSSRVVLYTPGAPDGRAFREFSDRATASREFLYAPAFREYLLSRLPAEYGEPLPNGNGRRFRVSEAARRTHWVLAAPGDGRGTVTEQRFEERLVDGDVRNALFDAEIVRQARDVAWLGRSTSQADAESLSGIVSSVLRHLRGPGAVVEDTVGAVGQALRATWRFYDSVKAGDGSQAFIDFTEAYTASLSVAGWYAGLSGGARPRLSLRPDGNAPRPTDAGVRITDAGHRLDPRYAIRSIDLSGTRPDPLGVHHLNGRRYIVQHKLVFELRLHRTSDTWRVARPNALDAAMPGPAVERTLAGDWRLRTDIGLRGGRVDEAAFPQQRTRSISGQDIEGLTEFQRWTFQQSFIGRLRNGGEASRIYWEAISQAGPRQVTLRQRTAWNDALRTARETPTEPIPVGRPPMPGESWRILPPNEWPAGLWHYPTGSGIALRGDGPLLLNLQALPGSGLTGLSVTTQATAGEGGSPWIRLNLDRYRTRRGTPESPGITLIEVRRGPEPTYVLQPHVGFPTSFLGLEAGDFSVGATHH
jgi:hypothetical protein